MLVVWLMPRLLCTQGMSWPLADSYGYPDGIDLTITLIFLGLAFGLPALGYACMVLDIRAYLRSLRRALVRVVNYLPHLPHWAREETPRCLAIFGLTLESTEEQLRQAYRKKAKDLHPDRGGDRQRFLVIQEHYEQALKLLREPKG